MKQSLEQSAKMILLQFIAIEECYLLLQFYADFEPKRQHAHSQKHQCHTERTEMRASFFQGHTHTIANPSDSYSNLE
jgi:hypothetical protein